jgi:hypothetical protein
MIGGADRPGYIIRKRDRSWFWEVIDPAGELVCVTVYKRGAAEVVRRLAG